MTTLALTTEHTSLKARAHAKLDSALKDFADFSDSVERIKELGEWRSDGDGYTNFKLWFRDEFYEQFGALYGRFQQLQRALPLQQRAKDELGIEVSERAVRPLLSAYDDDEQIDILAQAKRVATTIGDEQVQPRHIKAVTTTREAMATTGSVPVGGGAIVPGALLDYETIAEAHEAIEATHRMNERKQAKYRKVGATIQKQQGRMVYLVLDDDVQLPETLTLSIEDFAA